MAAGALLQPAAVYHDRQHTGIQIRPEKTVQHGCPYILRGILGERHAKGTRLLACPDVGKNGFRLPLMPFPLKLRS